MWSREIRRSDNAPTRRRNDGGGYVSPLNSTILDDVTPRLRTKRMFSGDVERPVAWTVCNDTTVDRFSTSEEGKYVSGVVDHAPPIRIDKLAYLRMLLTGRCEPIASNRGTLSLLLWIHGERVTIGIYRTISLE